LFHQSAHLDRLPRQLILINEMQLVQHVYQVYLV
jgi:hypothetical protein